LIELPNHEKQGSSHFDKARIKELLDKQEKEQYDYKKDMLEKELRGLYEAAHAYNTKKLRIKLATKPISAKISNLMLVPFLTRSDVQQTPDLRHSFQNIWMHIGRLEQNNGRPLTIREIFVQTMQELEKLASSQANKNRGVIESTIIAQVVVDCREIFLVKDTEIGRVIQGDASGEKNVTHLVRFEAVVRGRVDGGHLEMGSWQITDWDDLLDGNVWFM